MAAFFAMIWDSKDGNAVRHAASIKTRLYQHLTKTPASLRASGFCIYDLGPDSSGPGLLELRRTQSPSAGAVFGTLYRRCEGLVPAPPLSRMDPADTQSILASAGQALISDFWGSYVAFLNTAHGMAVIPDPTSSIPCFYRRTKGVTQVFSNLEACGFLDLQDFSINYDFVGTLLAYDKIQNGQTGLNEVCELAGGERLIVSAGKLRKDLLWDPRRIARRTFEPTMTIAEQALRDTIGYVVKSRAAACTAITLQLSGGLDSAIVAAMLGGTKMPARSNAIHFMLQSDDPPERAYARQVAGHAGLQIEDVSIAPGHPLPAADQHPLSVRPFRSFLGQDLTTQIAGLPQADGHTIFTGQGGDHLFLETRSWRGFAEYVHHHGPGRQAPAELLNAARLSGLSIWQILGKTLGTTVADHNRDAAVSQIRERQTRLNRNAQAVMDPGALLPEWATRRQGLPAAKFNQIGSLVHMLQIRSGLALSLSRPVIHPLISQPLIELCLRFPTYQLCAGGQGRGLVRRAMAGMVPDEVRLRRSKGDASRFYIDQLDAHRETIMEALRHGELVRHGLLARADLDMFLGSEEFRRLTFGRMLLVCYAIEAWLQSWKQVRSAPHRSPSAPAKDGG